MEVFLVTKESIYDYFEIIGIYSTFEKAHKATLEDEKRFGKLESEHYVIEMMEVE